MAFPTGGFQPVSAQYKVEAVAPGTTGAMIIRMEYVVAEQDVFSGTAPVDLGDLALAAGADAVMSFLVSNGWTALTIERIYSGLKIVPASATLDADPAS